MAAATTDLMAAATKVRDALRDGDYEALAAMVSPDENVAFDRFGMDIDLGPDYVHEPIRLSPQEISQLEQDAWSAVYTWEGYGEPTKTSFAEYLDSFVWDRDYDDAPYVTVDDYHSGDADLDPGPPNVAEDFGPTAHWVEYCFPAPGEGEGETALYLVFRETATGYYLIGIINSQWTHGAG
ncbi:MAG: hypothetical protein LBU50_04940 [Cellulomonas sp.]|jgi:hypothetical protein|nr:hypothetical protein [Cellulomonas sp.]